MKRESLKFQKEKNKNIVAVDTSSRVLSVAIQSSEGGRYEINLEGTPRHSEQVIGFIDQGLRSLKLKKKKLDHFLWGLGPGSFTGLRIGMSLLKGFHFGFNKRAFGASSLDLVALGVPQSSGKLAVCMDARREKVYLALYTYNHGLIEKTFGDAVVSIDQFVSRLDHRTILAGDALAVYGGQIRQKLGKEMVFTEPIFWYPRALFLLHLYTTKKTWLRPLNLKTMSPQYLRISEAEENLLKLK